MMRKNGFWRFATYFVLLGVLFGASFEAPAQRKKDLERARKIARQGDQLFNQKNYREAINRYAEALAIVPGFAAAHYWKGLAHYNLNETEQALADWQTALAQGYDRPLDIYKVRWQLNYQAKNLDAAMRDAAEAARLDPNNAVYNLALGDIHRQKGNYAEAVGFYKKAAEQDSNNPDVHYFIAVSQAGLNNHSEQGLAAIEALKRNTKFRGESYFLVADALNRSKKTDEAIEYYRKAIETKPDLYGPYPALSDLYRVDNRFEEAIQIANQGLRYYPMDSNLFTSLSWYYSLADKPIEAINSAKAAINLAPDQYMGYTNLCRAYNDAKQPQQAIAACSEALKLRPNDGETHLYIGRAYEANGKEAARAREHYRKAVAGLEQFTQENPDYSDGFYLLGNAYFLVERDDKAIEAYKRCLQLAPRFARARYTIGVAYLAKGDKSAARAQYDILKDIDNNWAARLLEQMNGK